MSECTVFELTEQMENGEIRLIDVREKMEFAGGRINGAELIPLGELAERHKELDQTRPIYVMCRTGRRSAEAQKKLHALGFTNVINVLVELKPGKRKTCPSNAMNTHRGRSIDRLDLRQVC